MSSENKKLVVHIARTSLAGAPIRIVNALNKYTDYNARLITYLPSRAADGSCIYQEDLNWMNNKEEALNLIKQADIIHFHHWFEMRLNPFLIDFNEVCKPNCKFLRHFHSDKEYLEKGEVNFAKLYDSDVLPKVVIPHCPERTFLDLPIVPNIFPINDEEYLPKETHNEKIKVLFSATSGASMYVRRWNTKGYEQVSKLLKDLSEEYDFEYVEVKNKTFKEAMQLKRECDIVVGDIVTGSYHLTELEGLCQGKPTLTWLDGRSVSTFMNVFKSPEVPFVNVNIDYIKDVLPEIVKNEALRKDLGKYSRYWIEKYYRDDVLIKKFEDVYSELLTTGNLHKRENSDEFAVAKEFLNNTLYDINWMTRCKEQKY